MKDIIKINIENIYIETYDVEIDFPFYCKNDISYFKVISQSEYLIIYIHIPIIDIVVDGINLRYNSPTETSDKLIYNSLNNIVPFSIIDEQTFKKRLDICVKYYNAFINLGIDDLLNLEDNDLIIQQNRIDNINKIC